jgi:hypothetical protein
MFKLNKQNKDNNFIITKGPSSQMCCTVKNIQVNSLSARGTPDRIQAMAPSHEHMRALQSSKYFGNRAVKVVSR